METKRGDTHLLHAGWPNGHWFHRPKIGWEILEPIENRDGLDGLEGGAVALGISLSTLRAASSESGTLRPTCLGAKRAPKVLH